MLAKRVDVTGMEKGVYYLNYGTKKLPLSSTDLIKRLKNEAAPYPSGLYFAPMEHIEHLGIAVKDLAASIPVYEKLLNTKCYKREAVDSENVITAFFRPPTTKSSFFRLLLMKVQ